MWRVGIDVGGTFIKAGLVNASCEIVSRAIVPFPAGTPEQIACTVADAAREVLRAAAVDERDVSHLGMVVPGSIDAAGETVIDAHNLGFHDVPFRTLVARQFPTIPVSMANDAQGAALAELQIGALEGCKTAVLLTLGTGLGAAVVLNGRLFAGGTGQGVELGHMLLVHDGEPCTCGNKGCAEAYCSASALLREARRVAANAPDSLLARCFAGVAAADDAPDARLVIDCVRAGDSTAQAVFAAYIHRLSALCASVFNIFDPEVIAIGGGLCAAGDLLFEPLRAQTSQQCFFRTHGALVPAAAGNSAGILGAALLGGQCCA